MKQAKNEKKTIQTINAVSINYDLIGVVFLIDFKFTIFTTEMF